MTGLDRQYFATNRGLEFKQSLDIVVSVLQRFSGFDFFEEAGVIRFREKETKNLAPIHHGGD